MNVMEAISERSPSPSREVLNGGEFKHLRRVAFSTSSELCRLASLMKVHPFRAAMVDALIEASGLNRLPNFVSLLPLSVGSQHLCEFHAKGYIHALSSFKLPSKKRSREGSPPEEAEEGQDKASPIEAISVHDLERYGLVDDCNPFAGLWELSCLTVGASLACAKALTEGSADVAINWHGGRHHAHRDLAAGFCFVNDIVLALLAMRPAFPRILYLDIDCHHGDAVQNAFEHTKSVLFVSFHGLQPGFFPGTGHTTARGKGRGEHHTVNVPLAPGLSDETWGKFVLPLCQQLCDSYQPQAIVLVCGADGLARDPLGAGWNLTEKAYLGCVELLLSLKIPLLVLGGGGYHEAATARMWTAVTAMCLGQKLPAEIPEHHYFRKYGPDFAYDIEPMLQPDQNKPEAIRDMLALLRPSIQKMSQSE